MKFIIVFLCLVSTSLFAKIDSPLVYLTWTEDPMSTMTIQWLTSNAKTDSSLFYMRDSKHEKTWNQTSGNYRLLPQDKPYIVHRVVLKNLTPDTIYKFHFGDKSKVHKFRTMPLDLKKPVRFIVGGDACNTTIDRFRDMSHKASKMSPRFAIIGGDIAYAAPKEGNAENFSRWCDFFRCWMKDMKDKDGCQIPLFVAIGNHEVAGHFGKTPKEAPFYYAFFERACYDFGFGNYAHFTFLDSGHTHGIKGHQKVWIENTLKTHTKYLHRFVTYHVGAYPSVGKFNDHVRDHIRKYWVPIFEKYRVDACFESHDHAYKRTYPLLQDKPHPDGIVYYGDGSWGVKPREPKEDRSYIAHTRGVQQVLVVELYQDKRRFWAVDLEGTEFDHFEQAVRPSGIIP